MSCQQSFLDFQPFQPVCQFIQLQHFKENPHYIYDFHLPFQVINYPSKADIYMGHEFVPDKTCVNPVWVLGEQYDKDRNNANLLCIFHNLHVHVNTA